MPTDRPPTDTPRSPSTDEARGPLFVDTNVFLRYLTNDVPEQADQVQALFDRAEVGEVRLVTSVLVIAEVVWTLGSFYDRTKEQVRDAVLVLCHVPGLDVEDADGLVQAAEWHVEKNVDFADAYHATWALAHGLTDVRTFNLKHFRRFDALDAREPS
ncbi:PIN domain-containing protein [Rubrivirga sp.]|uniref:PIN domain-containing protein n=1 Tax=Rubrivirga sp. TaxID=1885344 RepID=UPI003C73E0BC